MSGIATGGPPPEVVRLVLAALHGDRAALRSCALVHRTWATSSQGVLLDHVLVHDDNRGPLFETLRDQRLALLVRHVTYNSTGTELDPRLLGSSVRMPSVKVLELVPADGKLDMADLDEFFDLLTLVPSLQSLRLSYTRFEATARQPHRPDERALGIRALAVHSAAGIVPAFRAIFDHTDLRALERLELSLGSTGDCLKVQTVLRRVPRLRALRLCAGGPSLDLKMPGMFECMGHWRHDTQTLATIELHVAPGAHALPFALGCARALPLGPLCGVCTLVLRFAHAGARRAAWDPFADGAHRAADWAAPRDEAAGVLGEVTSLRVEFVNIARVENASAFLALFDGDIGPDTLSVEWNGATSDCAIPSACGRYRVGTPRLVLWRGSSISMFEADADEEEDDD